MSFSSIYKATAIAFAFAALSTSRVTGQTSSAADSTETSSSMHEGMQHNAMADDMAHKAGENATIKSEVTAGGPLAVGKEVNMILSLSDKAGKPVTFDDLTEIHTRKIHLLTVDPSLGDYHHIHPEPAGEPGKYKFTFTPNRAGKYIFYSDLLPAATNKQEYSLSTLEVPGEPSPIVKQNERHVKTGDYTFDLTFDKDKLIQGDSIRATLRVSGPDGQPFTQLEPVMGAFAHMVAFSEDRTHIAHIHPQGKEPEKDSDRGGPELNFYMNITKPGYHLLYSQVQINGKDVFAAYGLQIEPRQIPNTVAGIFSEVNTTMARLENVVEGKELAQIHGLAFWTRDLLSGLPKAQDVPAEAKAELEQSIMRIQSYADLLDRYGDSAQVEQASAVYKRFKAEVEKIRALVKAPAAASASADATALNNTNCPVSKMPVGSMEPGAAIVYKGVKIGLCCSGCKETFQKDPDAYLEKARSYVK